MVNTGKAVKVALAKREKTQTWLAEQIGVHHQVVSRWCNNMNQMKVNTLEEIGDCLDYSVKEMIEFGSD